MQKSITIIGVFCIMVAAVLAAEYSYTSDPVSPTVLHKAIVAETNITAELQSIRAIDTAVTVYFATSLSGAEETLLDGIAADLPLDTAQCCKCLEIDERTDELLTGGFTYAGNKFSMLIDSRSNYQGMKIMESVLTWPVGIFTLDGGSYDLTQTNLTSFLGTCTAVYKATYDGGKSIKDQVMACTNVAAVNAIVDSR